MANVINATSTGNGGLVSTGDDSGILNIQTNETTAITVDASQNVGIGNTTPSSYNLNAYKLVIGSNSSVTGITLASGTSAAGNIFFARGTSGTDAYDGYMQYGQNGQYMAFGTGGGTERMRITSAGYLCIGATATVYNESLRINTANQQGIHINETTSSSSCNYQYFTKGSGPTNVGAIYYNGSTMAYQTTSDYRLKENVVPLTGALDKVAQLKPSAYRWKESQQEDTGFIAHELQEVFPQVVSGTKDQVDADGNPIYQAVDTSFLVATLTAALQELKAINDQQTETINALTARVVAIESKA